MEYLNNNLDINQVLIDLAPFFEVERFLEVGVGLDDFSVAIVKNAKQVERITIDKDLLSLAEKKYSGQNIKYRLMSAEKLEYEDEYFNCVYSSSFHEFYPSIQKQALNEMYRVLKKNDMMIFIEPRESSITNELFKVFDPKEDHASRIRNSRSLLIDFIKEKNMDIVTQGNAEIIQKFNSLNDYNEAMLAWWSDIKIPKDEEEKKSMIQEIDRILASENMLDNLTISEDAMFIVIKK